MPQTGKSIVTESRLVVAKGWGGEREKWGVSSFGSDENIWECIRGGGYTTLGMYEMLLTCRIKMVNVILCLFCLCFLKINEIILVLRNPRGGLLFGRQGHIKAHYSDYLLLNSKFSKIQRLQPTLLCYQFMGQKLGQGTAEINCPCSTMYWESAEKTQTARESSGCLFTHLSGTCVCMSVTQSCPVTSWTAACQPPLFMGFSRQECWSGLSFPSPGDLSNPGIKPMSPAVSALAGGFFTTEPLGKSGTQARVICRLRSAGTQNTITGPFYVTWASSQHGSLRAWANQAETL